jgi:hypothetical protein
MTLIIITPTGITGRDLKAGVIELEIRVYGKSLLNASMQVD